MSLIFSWDQLILVGAPVARGVAGWIEKALADGKVETFEWMQLFNTIMRLGVPAGFLYFGLHLDPGMAAAIPVLADYFFKYGERVVKASKAKAK